MCCVADRSRFTPDCLISKPSHIIANDTECYTKIMFFILGIFKVLVSHHTQFVYTKYTCSDVPTIIG